MKRLAKADMRRLFEMLDDDLRHKGTLGEVYLVGGAVMCLVFDARDATQDVDAVFKPVQAIRDAALRVANRAGVHGDWLNDAVKGFLSPRREGEFDPYLELGNLKVFVARPEYLLAMKCAALRLGEDFHDLDDVRYLLRFLNITEAGEAMAIVTRYFEESDLLPKTRLALEEILTR